MFSYLENRVTLRSEPILNSKFKNLLRQKNQEQYEEHLTEIQVAFLLAGIVSPISLEPLVPIEQLNSANPIASPDFGIRLPDDDVLVEVTVLRVNAINLWDAISANLVKIVENKIYQRNLTRIVKIRLPFPLPQDLINLNSKSSEIADLVDQIAASEASSTSILISGKTCLINWTTPKFEMKQITNSIDNSITQIYTLPTLPIVSSEMLELDQEDVKKIILKSIRNTIDAKRKQFPFTAPYLLILKLGHPLIIGEAIPQLIEDYFWPKQDYKRITGIGFFKPQITYLMSDSSAACNFILNPKSACPPSTKLKAFLSGIEQFHT